MTPTTVLDRSLGTFIAVVLSFAAAAGTAQEVQTISQGNQVDVTASLVPGKLNLIDFYADWCSPCRALAPQLDRLAAAHSDSLAIRKIDIVDWDSNVTAQYRIRSIPHLKLFDEDGRLLAEGNPAHVMGILKNRLGGDGMGAGTGRSIMPLFLLGGLASLAVFLVLRAKSSSKSPNRQSVSPSRSGEQTASGWFVMMQNSLEGPFAEEDLEEMLRSREISANARARRRGQSTWTTVEEIVEHLI